MDIRARIEADEESDAREQTVQETDVDIDATASSVRIKSDYGKLQDRYSGFWDRSDNDNIRFPYIHYTITMPRTAQLAIKDFKSTIKVADLRSNLTIHTFKGPVTISGLDGSLDLDTYKSEVQVQFANLARGSHIETHKGNIEIIMPKEKGFDLDAELGKGDLDSDFALKISRLNRGWRQHNTEYHGSVNGGGPVLSLRTYKGSYRLRQR